MPEPDRLIERTDWPDVAFVEREATPEPAMTLGIQLHLAGLSLADTVSVLDGLGVQRCRTTVHNWIQKADLQPTVGHDPNHVAVDETVMQVTGQRFWLSPRGLSGRPLRRPSLVRDDEQDVVDSIVVEQALHRSRVGE